MTLGAILAEIMTASLNLDESRYVLWEILETDPAHLPEIFPAIAPGRNR